MNLEKYSFKKNKNSTRFRFTSVGRLGKIEKVVRYEQMENEEIYNLGFGDRNPKTGDIDDTIVTNNGDIEKVLATVAATMYLFTEINQNVYIHVTGSSESRIRLYRMAINKYFQEITKDFVIYTLSEDNEWQPFKSNSITEAFLIKRKL
jgi:hypothetical protein